MQISQQAKILMKKKSNFVLLANEQQQEYTRL
jgi:hypothetical protein